MNLLGLPRLLPLALKVTSLSDVACHALDSLQYRQMC